MRTAWEQAFGLLEHHGCCGAGEVVTQGIRSTEPGRSDVVGQ